MLPAGTCNNCVPHNTTLYTEEVFVVRYKTLKIKLHMKLIALINVHICPVCSKKLQWYCKWDSNILQERCRNFKMLYFRLVLGQI